MTFGGAEILLTLKIAAAMLQITTAVHDYRAAKEPRAVCVVCVAPVIVPDAEQHEFSKATGQGF